MENRFKQEMSRIKRQERLNAESVGHGPGRGSRRGGRSFVNAASCCSEAGPRREKYHNFQESGRGFSAEGKPTEQTNEQERDGQEVIYGRRPVVEALRSGVPLQRLYVLKQAVGVPKEVFSIAREEGIAVVHCDRTRLDFMCSHANHQGVAALKAARNFNTVEEIMNRCRQSLKAPFLLILDEVQDPGNFGALLRTAEASGVDGVIVTSSNSCSFTPAVTRASAGADQHLLVARLPKLGNLLRQLRSENYTILGADSNTDCDYTQADYRGAVAIVMGAEGKGLRPSVKELCTHLVKIPMLGRIESLNVSVAGGIMMYEVVRQRLKS
ncbi:MAG: 23S rRNA (guanosine(2251)-2'-O)-methyltransferase RlmB [Candidatus Bruticola sp.]